MGIIFRKKILRFGASETKKYSNGFTVLYAMLVASLLVSVGLSMAEIAVREAKLSSAAIGSQAAFFAANSGIECAIYWDFKNPSGVSAFSTTTASTIICNGQTISTNSQTVPTVPSTPSLVGGGGTANPTSIFYLTFTGGSKPLPYCVIVTVNKTQNGGAGPLAVLTKIEARGYNSCDTTNSRRVERGILVQY